MRIKPDRSGADLGENRTPTGTHSAGPTVQRTARILVVDDLPDNRDILSRRLTRRGLSVVEAEGGIRALELIEQSEFDIVLLDLMMPDVSGVDVLRRVRQLRSRFELPIIVVSAKSESEDVVECLNLGANDYVLKPVDLDVLLARMKPQLDLKCNHFWEQNTRQRIEEQAAALRNDCGSLLQSVRSLSNYWSEQEDTSNRSVGLSDSGDGQTQTRRVYKSGKIVFNDRSSVIDCIIWRQSHSDALLRVEVDSGVPEEFELNVGNSAPLNCQVVTRAVNEIGVRFLGRAAAARKPEKNLGIGM